MSRYQIGSLRQEQRKAGPTWVLRFYAQKGTKRVERTVAVGLVSDFPSEFAARQEVARQHLLESINQPEFQGPFTFGDLAQHYEENELGDQFDAVDPKSHSTIAGYKRNLRLYILPKWGRRVALGIEPLEIEHWLKTLKRERNLQNPTMDKQRRLMNLVYKSAQRYGLLPRTLQDDQRLRGSDNQPRSRLGNMVAATRTGKHTDVAGCYHRAPNQRVPWSEVGRR